MQNREICIMLKPSDFQVVGKDNQYFFVRTKGSKNISEQRGVLKEIQEAIEKAEKFDACLRNPNEVMQWSGNTINKFHLQIERGNLLESQNKSLSEENARLKEENKKLNIEKNELDIAVKTLNEERNQLLDKASNWDLIANTPIQEHIREIQNLKAQLEEQKQIAEARLNEANDLRKSYSNQLGLDQNLIVITKSEFQQLEQANKVIWYIEEASNGQGWTLEKLQERIKSILSQYRGK